MTARRDVKICLYCDRPIEGVAIPASGESHLGSANGARADDWRHVKGDRACRAAPFVKRFDRAEPPGRLLEGRPQQ